MYKTICWGGILALAVGASAAITGPLGTVVSWGDQSRSLPVGLSGIVQVQAGWVHSLALTTNGTVIGWGVNNHGDLNIPSDLSNVVAIAAGGIHSLALRADGTIVGWGYPATIGVPEDWQATAAIAAGYWHTLALKSNGVAAVWGSFDNLGQLDMPAEAQTNIMAIASGEQHCLVLTSNGTVVTWGDNTHGQTNLPPGLSNIVSIACGGYHSLALRNDGTVFAWGFNASGEATVPAGLSNVLALAGGDNHSLALLGDGTVVGWGDNSLGQLNIPPGFTNVTAIAAGGDQSLVLTRSTIITTNPVTRTVYEGWDVPFSVVATAVAPASYQWFFNGAPLADATNATLTLTNVQPFHAGKYYVAISNLYNTMTSSVAGLTVWMPPAVGAPIGWGDYSFGQAAPPPGLTNVIAVSGGGIHSLALNRDGTVVGWGKASYRFDGVLSNALAIAAGGNHSLALLSDGTIASAGDDSDLQLPDLRNLSNFVSLAAGLNNSVGVKPDGTVVGWGRSCGCSAPPAGLSNVFAVAAGSYHNLALTRKGTVVGWGWAGQDVGQIHPPPGLSNVVAIAAGFYHSLALKNDGSIVGWGQNTDGQLNVPPGLTNAIAIGAGVNHSMALAPDGKVWAWGNNTYGQTNIPAYLSGVVGLAAGEFFGLAISRAPIILTQVVSRVVTEGTNLSLEVVASGIGHLTYQWQFNGSDIAGATNRTLDFINVQTNDSGSYTVIIKNEHSQVASGATLLATIPPTIVQPPETQTVLAGTNVTFSVVATGFPSLSYQWRRFGSPIPGETNSVLMLTNVQNSGSYDVLVSNAGGSQASAAAGLTVLRPASISPTNFLARYDVTNGFSFKMNVQFGRYYRIQMSTNLAAWSDVTNFVSSATVIGFFDPAATNRSPCFYRMVSP